jgi:putative NIF3 family GTP cyclohydrolase 1 type 2
MKAKDFREHCISVAPWVCWDGVTCDLFMHGDPEAEVKGIATTWLATDAVIREAAAKGLNFIIAHEGAFYPTLLEWQSEQAHHQAKHDLMDELGITLLRCHDTWDRMPEYGIPDTWAAWLGFEVEPRDVNSFYCLSNLSGMTVGEVAKHVLEKTKPLGQMGIGIMGDPHKPVTRLATGTGAITRLPAMAELGADILIATDDGCHTTNNGLYSLDLDIPVLIVAHPTAELPGMMKMVDYIEQQFPPIPVEYLPCGFPYPWVTG